jgi:hypothetical protein
VADLHSIYHAHERPPQPFDEDYELERELTDEELRAAEAGTPWMPPGEEDQFENFDFLEEAARQTYDIPDVLPSQFTETAFRMPTADGTYERFSFEGRRHMRRIYDTPARRILLCCGRQVEKCCNLTSAVMLANGMCVKAADIRTGQRVVCLDMRTRPGTRFTTSTVTWVSAVAAKPGVRLTTRQGHAVEVAATHPIRTWDGWVDAGDITPGWRIAVVRKAGEFGAAAVDPRRVELTAFMLGDGGMTQPTYTFTGAEGRALCRVEELLQALGHTFHRVLSGPTDTSSLRIHHNGPLYDWLAEDRLAGKYSYEKECPPWVFDLNYENSALFLNRLWATDGHVKKNSSSKYSIEYCSTSRVLARQLQALLWKFGVPTSLRQNQPSYVCRDGAPARVAHILRVETATGVRNFLQHVGAIGKSENVPLPTADENNNRDTYPIEVNTLLRQIIASNPRHRTGRDAKHGSLRSAGLRETLKYPPTAAKLQEYVDFFREDTAYAAQLVDQLAWHLETDVYWDEVERVEALEVLPCVDFEVADHHNFLVDGVVTHNSTVLGNRMLAYSCMVPAFKSLYVSPSATQTKTFSNDRVKEPLETSDILRAFTTTALQQNVFEKQFINRAKITLRYAFLNADRCRGIPAWLLLLDEFQDILGDSIPIIEQCLAHAPEQWKSYIYAGTPKGLDNTIEYYRSGSAKGKAMSTMGEWVVPCDRHGGDTGRYWNVLGEKNIQRKGLACEKCSQPIDPMHADSQWAAMQSEGIFESYRIPQLMVPWRSWDEIMLDYGRYDRARFYNEVLGISYDSGLRPLTRAQVQECCRPDISMHPNHLEVYKPLSAGNPIFAGIDWGGGSENSYTVLSLGTYINSRFRIFYVHRFVGEDMDPEPQLKKIDEILSYFNVRLIGVDHGGGFHPNDHLIRKFGPKRVHKYQYQSRGRRKIFWNPHYRRWQITRTDVMSDLFNAIKRKQIDLPRWTEFEDPYATDMLNIFAEYNETLRTLQYSHRPDRPDDTFHSILYCLLASMIVVPRPDIIAPIREIPGQGPLRTGYRGPIDQG